MQEMQDDQEVSETPSPQLREGVAKDTPRDLGAISVRRTEGLHMWEQREVAKRYLRGTSAFEIASELKLSYSRALAIVKVIREDLAEMYKLDIREEMGRTIHILRMVQKTAWDKLDRFPDPVDAQKMLAIVLRANETEAKITGVLTDRIHHIGDITHHVKLYDFEDKFPPSKVVEGEIISDSDIPVIENKEEYEQRIRENSPPSDQLKNVGAKSGFIDEETGEIWIEE